MKRTEPAPRYGAPLLFAGLIGLFVALAASPVILSLCLIAGRGAYAWVKP